MSWSAPPIIATRLSFPLWRGWEERWGGEGGGWGADHPANRWHLRSRFVLVIVGGEVVRPASRLGAHVVIGMVGEGRRRRAVALDEVPSGRGAERSVVVESAEGLHDVSLEQPLGHFRSGPLYCLSAQAQGPFVTLEQNGLWLSLYY